jgi:hypothetical protein
MSTAMVVVFFFLPGVLPIVFGMFGCVELDAPAAFPYTVSAVGSFFMYDVSVQCYLSLGYHKTLVLVLAMPLVLILCIGLPAVIAIKTMGNKQLLNDHAFLQHYGFLTRSYKSSCCYWEAVVVLETVVLVAVSVFGSSLNPLYQSMLMVAALAAMIALQAWFDPFVSRLSGRVRLQSAVCLLLTSFVAQSFTQAGNMQPSSTYSTVMSVLLLLLNVVYVCAVAWQLVRLVDWRQLAGAGNRLSSKLAVCSSACMERTIPANRCSGCMTCIVPAGKDASAAGTPA